MLEKEEEEKKIDKVQRQSQNSKKLPKQTNN